MKPGKQILPALMVFLCFSFSSVSRAQAPADIPVFKVTPVKSTIKFAVKASVPIEGDFQKWDASFTVTSTAVESGVLDIKIQADSVNTGSGMKDGKLKSKDFFNADQDRTLRFTPQRLWRLAPTPWTFRANSQFVESRRTKHCI